MFMNRACTALALASLAACSAPRESTACLTRSDCAVAEECIAGRCESRASDSGSAPDAAPSTDAAIDAFRADAAAPGVDAFVAPDASAPPVGESCADPIHLDLEGGRAAHAEGELSVYASSHSAFCGEAGTADVVFVIDIADGPRDIEITTSGIGGTDTVVAMSETCEGGGEFYSCHDDRSPDDQSTRMILHRYPSPQLFVMVRGFGADDLGHFSLDVVVTSPANTSTCATPWDLTGGAYVVAWGASTDAAPHASCLTPAGPQVSDVYHVRRDGEMTVDGIDAYFGDIQGAITLVDSCTAPVTETWCGLSTWRDDSYFGAGIYGMPFQTPEDGYLVVAALPTSPSYSFSFYP